MPTARDRELTGQNVLGLLLIQLQRTVPLLDQRDCCRKKECQEIELINKAIEEDCKAQWELETATRRMDLNRPGKAPGRPPVWSFTQKNRSVKENKDLEQQIGGGIGSTSSCQN